ncbi:MAG: deoxyguanosinetriphosphate triphosphohydrolase [Prosthecobacter sp.]|nr:deoxyguanosinetriphosphate triphosphohydrolase [Prosthecobacter sp.]
MASFKARFKHILCAPGLDNHAIEARYTRLSGAIEKTCKSADFRIPSEKDRDRVLYSSSFRRLGEITQVIPRERGYILHNRLTHSLKVAQLGRRMAERLLLTADGTKNEAAIELANKLGGLDPNIVETAALAHDLGHPPFGHIIEEFLDKKTKPSTGDGYEGNAQSFRIVTYLENRDTKASKEDGLDLTLASLNATLKYPWCRDVSDGARGKKVSKFGYYAFTEPDKNHFKKVRDRLSPHCGGEGNRSLEAELMDWADDIAYAIYDIEDFYRAGLIPLDKIIRECLEQGEAAHTVDSDNEMHFLKEETRHRWKLQGREDSEIAGLEDSFSIFSRFLQETIVSTKSLGTQQGNTESGNGLFNVASLSLRSSYRNTEEQRHALAILTSSLVEEFTAAISLNPDAVADTTKSKVVITNVARTVVKILKELTWTYVIDNADLHAIQYGQQSLVEFVYDTLMQAAQEDKKILPKSIRDKLTDGTVTNRIVTDVIAGMSESQIVDLYGRFTGNSAGTLLRSTYMA